MKLRALLLLAVLLGAGCTTLDEATGGPFDRLEIVGTFALGSHGKPGEISEGEAAFRSLAKRRDAAYQFKRLLNAIHVEGQLYALLGLRTTDPKLFQQALPFYLASKEDAMTAIHAGDPPNGKLRPVKEVAGQIARGEIKIDKLAVGETRVINPDPANSGRRKGGYDLRISPEHQSRMMYP